tara:strand:- start:820 stop:1683 length:864 start_codon:yes stop_codon:yes gene_type:complete
MDISFCIVSLNSIKLLKKCLDSIPCSVERYSYEVIVADNHSYDNTIDILREAYPKVRLIKNNRNIGYTKAMNKILKLSRGNFKVVLNPDSKLMECSISKMVDFMRGNSMVGVVGPKVVDSSGQFQMSCRRGLAKPEAVFSYFFGLAKKFPKNLKFTGYHLNHLNEDEINQVSGISGSCMLINGKLIKKIGYFDEIFSIYQEDSDFCLRSLNSGWKVFYFPKSKVMHMGGRGGTSSYPYKMILEWHRSYIRFYFKHFSEEYSTLFNLIYLLIMLIKLLFAEIVTLVRR